VVTDGPFAETREQLGGYYVIEARDLDEAIGNRRTDSPGAFWDRGNPAGNGNWWPAGELNISLKAITWRRAQYRER